MTREGTHMRLVLVMVLVLILATWLTVR